MPPPTSDRRSEILEHSKALLRTRGFNAFSHRDLATLVGVKSSSVHYYFPSKEDIGLALVAAYRQEILSLLASLEHLPVPERLEQFASVFASAASSGDQWCVAGMLASDYATLGEDLQAELRRFFDAVEAWLATQARLIRPGLSAPAALQLGKASMALLEGSLLLARCQQEPQRVSHAAEALKALMGVGPFSG